MDVAIHAPGGVLWVSGDVLNTERMCEVPRGADVVNHLAARITLKQGDPRVWQLNTSGPRTLAEAALAAGVRRMVHCSSVHTVIEHGMDIAIVNPTGIRGPIAEPRGHWLGGDVMSEAAFASLGPSSTVSHAKASSEPGYVVRPATE